MGSASDFNSEDELAGPEGFMFIDFPNEVSQLGNESPAPSSLRLSDSDDYNVGIGPINIDEFLCTNDMNMTQVHENLNLDGNECLDLEAVTCESSDDSDLRNNYADSRTGSNTSSSKHDELDELFFPKPCVQENKNNNKSILSLGNKRKKDVTYVITHPVPVDGFMKSKPSGGDSNSKNAIAARDNRLKKKKYVAGLEETIKDLKNENKYLSVENEKHKQKLMVLKNEVTYLRSVIANQTTLAAILRNVSKTPGIKLSTSFLNQSTKNCDKKTALDQNLNEDNSVNPSMHSNSHSEQVKKGRTQRSSRSFSFVEAEKISKPSYQRETLKGINLMEISKSKTDQNKSTDYFRKWTETKDDFSSQHLEDTSPINVEDSDSDEPSKSLTTENKVAAGICFHVSGENVSLEFCSQCSSKAHTEIMTDHSYVKFSSTLTSKPKL